METPKYCETCRFWGGAKGGKIGKCSSTKIREDVFDGAQKEDELVYSVYSYPEDGSFWAGRRFGCVHHTESDHGNLKR